MFPHRRNRGTSHKDLEVAQALVRASLLSAVFWAALLLLVWQLLD